MDLRKMFLGQDLDDANNTFHAGDWLIELDDTSRANFWTIL